MECNVSAIPITERDGKEIDLSDWGEIGNDYEEYLYGEMIDFFDVRNSWFRIAMDISSDFLKDILAPCQHVWIDWSSICDDNHDEYRSHLTIETDDEEALRREVRSRVALLMWYQRKLIRSVIAPIT